MSPSSPLSLCLTKDFHQRCKDPAHIKCPLSFAHYKQRGKHFRFQEVSFLLFQIKECIFFIGALSKTLMPCWKLLFPLNNMRLAPLKNWRKKCPKLRVNFICVTNLIVSALWILYSLDSLNETFQGKRHEYWVEDNQYYYYEVTDGCGP